MAGRRAKSGERTSLEDLIARSDWAMLESQGGPPGHFRAGLGRQKRSARRLLFHPQRHAATPAPLLNRTFWRSALVPPIPDLYAWI